MASAHPYQNECAPAHSGLPARSEIPLEVLALPPPGSKNPPTPARGSSQRQNRALEAKK